MDTLVFSVSQLLHAEPGEKQSGEFEVNPKLKMESDLVFKGGLSGKITIMRIEEGMHILVEDLETEIELDCQRCLKKYTKDIYIEETERLFYEKAPKYNEDTNDIFLIDIKSQTIDISEMLRQEIILHFPIVSVCSKSCKGLCPKCGVNLNKSSCTCELDDAPKPLSILKELYNGKTSGTQKEDI